MKICTVSDAVGCSGFVFQNRLLNAVNNSGAVSPAMRASARMTPVMMPGSAAGSTTRERRPRPRGAQRQRAFAQCRRHEPQQFFGGSRDDRNHHHAERDAAGEHRELPHLQHDDAVDEHADHDRRHAVQRVGGEADDRREPRAATPTCRCR